MKMTPQRMAIIEYLEGNGSHPCAEDVYEHVRAGFPTMSLATVYNTLGRLFNEGKLLELTVDPERKRYDPDTSPHHHIICIVCGKVADIHMEFDLPMSGNEIEGFRVISNQVQFRGVCAECDGKEGA